MESNDTTFRTTIDGTDGDFAVMLTNDCPKGFVGFQVLGEVDNLVLTLNKKGNEKDDYVRLALEEQKLDIQEEDDFENLVICLEGQKKGQVIIEMTFGTFKKIVVV
jgi:hypothetical protein